MSPGPIQLDQATALTLMLGPNGSVGIQASEAEAAAFIERAENELLAAWKEQRACKLGAVHLHHRGHADLGVEGE